jgi:hypothetical protein
LGYIFSSFLIEGTTIEELPKKFGKNFVQNFKDSLTNKIEKYQSKGLKSVKITSLNTYNHDSLIIEFVSVVNPKYHQQIISAIRRALSTIDVSLYSFFTNPLSHQLFSSSSNKHSSTDTNNDKNNSININILYKYFYPNFLLYEKRKKCHYKK